MKLLTIQAGRGFGEAQLTLTSSIICVGDTVAHCAKPRETIEAIRECGINGQR